MTQLMVSQINKSGININIEDDLIHCRNIKEKMSVVPDQSIEVYLNTHEDIIKEERMLYKMPDDSIIKIPKKARLEAAELLFK